MGTSIQKRARKRWKRLIAFAMILLGSVTMTLVAAYYVYDMVATSNLDQLVYPPPEPVQTPAPPAKKLVTNLDPGAVSVYPGSLLNPKYWSEPLWAGTDPVPSTDLPEGFEPIELSSVSATLHTLGVASSIQIPSIGVNSTVKELEILDLGDSRKYETPNNTIGHIPETGNPGEMAKGWFFGHLESPIRGEGNVFKDLPKIPDLLREGNPVFIILENKDGTFLYQTETTRVVHGTELMVENEASTTVTLVTCVPRFTYEYRLLVDARLVGVRSQG